MAKTIDEILDNIRTVLKEENSELANFPEYGNLYIIFRSLASVISEQDAELDSMYDSLFINTSNDKNLDQRAKEYGLERQKGTKAYGSVIVENSLPISGNFNTKIKRGTILLNPFTNKQYMVLKDVSLVGFRTLLEVESLEESSDSNLIAGTKLISNFYRNSNFIVGDTFNQLTNQYEGDIVGGSEKETDSLLRARILEVIKIKQSSTIRAIELAARSVRGVNNVLIEENVPTSGYINVFIDNTNFNVINEVKLRVERAKPLGVILSVKSFENTPININLTVSLYNQEDLANKDANIKSSITNFVSNLDQNFSKESLAGLILNNRYVRNVQVISPSSSLTISAKQKFVTGSISIQYV